MLHPWYWHGCIMDMVVNSWGAHPYNQGAWNQNQDLTVVVSNPNDTLWGRYMGNIFGWWSKYGHVT